MLIDYKFSEYRNKFPPSLKLNINKVWIDTYHDVHIELSIGLTVDVGTETMTKLDIDDGC